MNINNFLVDLGIQSEDLILTINIVFNFIIAVLVGWLSYVIVKKWLARLVLKIVGKTQVSWDDLLFSQQFFNRLAFLITIIVFTIVLSSIEWEKMYIIRAILNVCIVFGITMVLTSGLDGLNRVYSSYPVSKDKPIKVFIQVIDIFLYCAAFATVIGMVTGKDIGTLLAGLTAFAAVLMLVFKDSILGLVAGIQLSANNMVRIGDWIEMPSSHANGDVLEISLTTVKVQNWDKTITTIPTYKMVSESFTNWRGMQESDGRRIKRSINIDVNTVHYLSNEEIENLRKSALLKDYIDSKVNEIREFNTNRSSSLDERKLTNIGTFRGYIDAWLTQNPNINQDMTHMVRQLQPTPTGIPLEIYCFSAKQEWISYENVQSDIFDHVFAIMKLFNLRAFQYSGSFPLPEEK